MDRISLARMDLLCAFSRAARARGNGFAFGYPPFTLHFPRFAVLAIAVAMTACTPTWARANKAALVLADATLACDYGQTRWLSDGGRWDRPVDPSAAPTFTHAGQAPTPPRYWYETNPILGRHPSDAQTGVYLGTIAFTATAAYPALPPWARSVLYFTLAGIETANVLTNNHRGICGV